MSRRSILILSLVLGASFHASVCQATFILFPGAPEQVLDNGPRDADPRIGWIDILPANPIILSGWNNLRFSGSAKAEDGPTWHRTTITSAKFTETAGVGMSTIQWLPVGVSDYDLPWGEGVNIALLDGTLNKPGGGNLAGGEAFWLASVGTTFLNNTPMASWGPAGAVAPPVAVLGYDSHNGYYTGGPGQHWVYAQFIIGPNEEFVFPTSGVGELVVPAPGAIVLVGIGGCLLSWLRWRRVL